MVTIREVTPHDASTLVYLNDQSVAVTSPMDESRFHELLAISCLCGVAELDGQIAGFVLVMRHGANYNNGNFQWFSERLDEFVYVDRVVVAELGRGQGVGRALYAHVSAWAEHQAISAVAAEMDLLPPNAGSLNFHRKLGFHILGSRKLDSGKTVSMQVKRF